MRDYLMMRDMARAYEGLIMNNIEKAKADVTKVNATKVNATKVNATKVNATKVNELSDDFCIKDTNYHIEGEFKPFGVTDET